MSQREERKEIQNINYIVLSIYITGTNTAVNLAQKKHVKKKITQSKTGLILHLMAERTGRTALKSLLYLTTDGL